MALNAQIRAACLLLLLLLASLTSGSIFPQQTGQLADLQRQDTVGQLADLQRQDTAAARAGWTHVLQQRSRRDAHFPICVFCCGCCRKSKCGVCCKT
ncbi:hepcidin isoform X1 [Eulemur rufifrons]|uniref:hepcidin isoform X1 n=1 Tax=Eulemur rufifrons TaxID=859984 RepID=UPI003742819B